MTSGDNYSGGDDDKDGLNKTKRRLKYTNVVDSIGFLYHCL